MPTSLGATLAATALEPVITPGRAPGGGSAWLWVVGLLAMALVLVAWRRAGRAGAAKRSWRMGGGAAAGNALQDLASTLMPNRPDAAVVRRIDKEGEHDDAGDGRNPS